MGRLNWLVAPAIVALALVAAALIIAAAIDRGRVREDRRSLRIMRTQARDVLDWCGRSRLNEARRASDSAFAAALAPSWQREADGALRVLADRSDPSALRDAQSLRDAVVGMPQAWAEIERAVRRGPPRSAGEREENRAMMESTAVRVRIACDDAREVDSAVAVQLGTQRM